MPPFLQSADKVEVGDCFDRSISTVCAMVSHVRIKLFDVDCYSPNLMYKLFKVDYYHCGFHTTVTATPGVVQKLRFSMRRRRSTNHQEVCSAIILYRTDICF
nr:exonuclease 3'-5' domain-containing protein 2-like [Ipomoea batatas]